MPAARHAFSDRQLSVRAASGEGEAARSRVAHSRGRLEMKLKIVIVDLEIPPRAKKWGLRIGIPAAVLSVAAVALAAPLHVWSNGDTLQATDLNGNFTALQGSVPVVTAWQSYTPSLATADGAAITNGVVTGKYRRVGDTMEFSISVSFPNGPSGSPSVEQWLVTVPSGLQLDTSRISNMGVVGVGGGYTGGAIIGLSASLVGGKLGFGVFGQQGSLGTSFPSSGFIAGGSFEVHGAVPIVGWTVTQ